MSVAISDGRLELAKKWLSTLKSITPQENVALLELALAYKSDGVSSAAKIFEQYSGSPLITYHYARMCYQNGHVDKSRQLMQLMLAGPLE